MDDNLRTLYIGLSGGPDSVALLHLMRAWKEASGANCEIIALHCNFHLRGEESDRDQRFCEDFCQQQGVTLLVKEFDTYAYMQEQRLSLEMAARQLRYDWWASLIRPHSTILSPHSTLIALGHHQDDSIETTLMNLMRGTGINGLTGIVPRNEKTHVIRPLLCLSRQEILDYLHDNGLSYVTDSTNAENDTLRNQIRNQLLPIMQQIHPNVKQGISMTMKHLEESAQLSEEALRQWIGSHVTSHTIDGYTYEVTDVQSPYHFQLEQYYSQRGFSFDGKVATPIGQPLPSQPLPDPSLHETFDLDQLHQPLTWRRWQQGDRMDPLGMGGHTKLVSDIFTNAHFLPIQKQLAWILVDASGQIIWIPGLRMSHHARVTETTHHTITIHAGQQFDRT